MGFEERQPGVASELTGDLAGASVESINGGGGGRVTIAAVAPAPPAGSGTSAAFSVSNGGTSSEAQASGMVVENDVNIVDAFRGQNRVLVAPLASASPVITQAHGGRSPHVASSNCNNYAPSVPSLEGTPDSVLHIVLSYLQLLDIVSLMHSTKHLERACRSTPTLNFARPVGSTLVCKYTARTFKDVQHLRFLESKNITVPQSIIAHSRRLVSFLMYGMTVRDDVVRSIIDASIASGKDRSMENLALSGTVCLKHPTITRLAGTFTNLLTFDISGCRTLTDEGIAVVMSSMPKLTHLSVQSCTAIKEPHIAHASLKSLNVSECALLQALILDTPRLSVLNASNCRNISDHALVRMLSGCPAIRTLHLSGCFSLKRPSIRSGSLEFLDLAMCVQMAALEAVCPSATYLDLAMCSALDDLHLNLDAIQTLDLSTLAFSCLYLRAPALIELSLDCCRGVTPTRGTVDVHAPKLAAVSLHGASIPADVFPRTVVARGSSATGAPRMPEGLSFLAQPPFPTGGGRV